MKSKIVKKKPEKALELLKYSVAKMILKKDIKELRKKSEKGSSFFLELKHNYKDDKEFLLFVISTFDNDWKNYIKAAVKSSDKERMAYGHCFAKEGGGLLLVIEKGKAKIEEIKKGLKKAKITPDLFSNVIFKEDPTEELVEIEVEKEEYDREVPKKVAEKGLEYGNQKQRELEIKKALKDKSIGKKKKEALEREAGLLAIERQKTVDILYKQWLKDKGWEKKKPRDILKMYGDNWFTFKDELAYLDEDKNENPAYYEVKLAAMEKVLQYRKEIVDALLKETCEAVAQQKSNPLTKKAIKALALGSVTPTSDYDITFEIASAPHLEYKCVKYFNETFLKRYGVASGILFDTNVYTNGFMPSTNEEQTLIYKDKFNPKGKSSKLAPKERALIRKGKTIKHQTQLALSLVSIAQAIDKTTWDQFAKDTIREVLDYLSKRLPVKKDRKKELLLEVKEDLFEIFKKASTIHRQTENSIEREKKLLLEQNPKMNAAHVEGQSKDGLYVKALEMVANQLEALEINAKALETAKDKERESLLVDRVKLIVRFEEAQGKALIYSNEAYFSGGAAVHVVKGMQGGGEFQIGRQQKMQSVLMNIGYKVAHFKHQAEEHGIGRALVGTSKYGQRIGNIALSGTSENAPKVNQKLTSEMSTSTGGLDIKKLLKLEEDLVLDYKKNDEKYPTPSDKEEAAEEHLAEEFDDVSIDDFLNTFLEVGSKSLAPFYLDKFNDNLEKAGAGKENEVGFW